MRNLMLATAGVAFLAAPALADVIRVPKDFGTIQAAVNAAAPGDKIIVKAGTYPENVTVLAKPNLLIRGRGLVTINPAGGTAIHVNNSSGVRIKGVSSFTTGISFGIVFTNSPNGLASKCRAQGTLGIGAANSSGTRIVRCKVNTTAGGIGMGGTGTYTAERCEITSAATGRAVAVTGDTVNLVRCKVSYTGVPTVSPVLSNMTGRLTAERCRIQTAPAGVNIFGFDLQPAAATAQHVLDRNRIEGCNVAIGGVTANNVTATRNVMSGQAAGGIGLGGTGIVVDRNTILLGTGLTVGVGLGNTTGATISRNKIVGGGAGIWILNGNNNTMTRNKLKNLTVGITLTGNANTCGPHNQYKNCATPINDAGVGTIILDTP